MSELAPIGPEMVARNREVLAERLHWPDGALEACRDLEQRFQRWNVWYDTSRTQRHPEPGYTAWPHRERYGPTLDDPTPEGLAEQLAREDARLPRW